jgi:hypothetical protein
VGCDQMMTVCGGGILAVVNMKFRGSFVTCLTETGKEWEDRVFSDVPPPKRSRERVFVRLPSTPSVPKRLSFVGVRVITLTRFVKNTCNICMSKFFLKKLDSNTFLIILITYHTLIFFNIYLIEVLSRESRTTIF